jgi:predicted nucleic acid-binding protein
MKYLLDVNALIALGIIHHEFHDRVGLWLRAQQWPPVATCPITELGFVRVLAHVPAYKCTVSEARTLLLRLKQAKTPPMTFIQDNLDISHLPAWAKTPNQTTDGHLVELAAANDAVFATLDERIPGAYLIPHSPPVR